jgi:hypothetical protein
MRIAYKGSGMVVSVAAGGGVQGVVMDMYEVLRSHMDGRCTREHREWLNDHFAEQSKQNTD